MHKLISKKNQIKINKKREQKKLKLYKKYRRWFKRIGIHLDEYDTIDEWDKFYLLTDSSINDTDIKNRYRQYYYGYGENL